MNPEIIQLPDFVIADLYKDCLVELDEVQPIEPAPAVIKNKNAEEDTPQQKGLLKFLGENKKNIAVLVNETKASIINEDELDFLSKILTACNLNVADTAIINIRNQEVNYANLKEQFNAEFLLLLGVEPSVIKLPFSIPHFQVQPFSGTTIVSTPPLSGMLKGDEESVSLKRKLWTSLKTAFKL